MWPPGLYGLLFVDNGITWKAGAKLPAIPYKEKKYVGDFDPGSNQVGEESVWYWPGCGVGEIALFSVVVYKQWDH